MPISSPLPPSDSATFFKIAISLAHVFSALLLSFAFILSLVLAMVRGESFAGWEVERLSRDGLIAVERGGELVSTVSRYLSSEADGLIQLPRLTNPERHHLKTVKQLVDDTGRVAVLFLAAGLFLWGVPALPGGGWRVFSRLLKLWGICNLTLLAIGLLAFVLLGFGQLFVWMHQILFPVDDWLFPAGTLLTSLYPPQLFRDGLLVLAGVVMLVSVPAFAAGRYLKV